MIQIVGIIVGVCAIVMGIGALTKGEIKLSGSKTLKDGQAKVAGIATILLGVVIVLVFLFVIPIVMGI